MRGSLRRYASASVNLSQTDPLLRTGAFGRDVRQTLKTPEESGAPHVSGAQTAQNNSAYDSEMSW